MNALNYDQQIFGDVQGGVAKRGISILESLGYDKDSSYHDAMTYQVRNDRAIISSGGSVVNPQNQLIIRLEEDGCLQSVGSISVVGQMLLPTLAANDGASTGGRAEAWCWNLASLFRCQSIKLGSVQISFSNSEFYQQQKLELMNWDELRPIAYEMLVDMQDHSTSFANTGQTDNGLLVPLVNVKRGIVTRKTQPANATGGAAGAISFKIPLHILCPFFAQQSWQDQIVATGNGQVLEIVLYAMPTFQVFHSGIAPAGATYANTLGAAAGTSIAGTNFGGARADYQITNIALVHQYARLDPPQWDIIMKNEYIFHPIYNETQIVNPAAQTMNFTFSIDKMSKCRRLIFAFHGNDQPSSTAQGPPITLDTILGVAGGSPLQGLDLMPALRIRQVKILLGGQQIVFTSDSIGVLHMEQPEQLLSNNDGKLQGWRNGPLKSIRTVYCINLDRYPTIDLVGSSSKQQNLCLVQIQLDTTEHFIQTQDNIAIGAAHLAKLQCVTFLEKTRAPIIYRNGKYTEQL